MLLRSNAASVWMLEQLASVLRERGQPGDAEAAAKHAADAAKMAKGVLSLYEEGQGFFAALYPNGTRVGVRHVVDFVYVSEFMDKHLSGQQRAEMAEFVSTELLTDTWMRALSPKDAAAKASDRTDHGPCEHQPGPTRARPLMYLTL